MKPMKPTFCQQNSLKKRSKTAGSATSLAGLGPGGPVALGGAGQAPSEAPGNVAINAAGETTAGAGLPPSAYGIFELNMVIIL